jgi:hypothetical protein
MFIRRPFAHYFLSCFRLCRSASSSPPPLQHQIRKLLNASVASPSAKRVDVHGCSEPEELVDVSQSSDASLHTGMPVYTVEISNSCLDCAVCDVHLSCGDFANTELVDPATFRRLDFDDCLVKDGGPILPGDMISFEYANSFLYPMKVVSADCNCG